MKKDYNLKGFSRVCEVAIEEIGNCIRDLFNVTYINLSKYQKIYETD